MTEPQISDEAVELLARAISAEVRPWLWEHVSHESDRQMWRGEARELLGDLVPLLHQQWEAEYTGRCGCESPRIHPGGGGSLCELPAGHAGWHREGTTEWGRGDVPGGSQ